MQIEFIALIFFLPSAYFICVSYVNFYGIQDESNENSSLFACFLLNIPRYIKKAIKDAIQLFLSSNEVRSSGNQHLIVVYKRTFTVLRVSNWQFMIYIKMISSFYFHSVNI